MEDKVEEPLVVVELVPCCVNDGLAVRRCGTEVERMVLEEEAS